jgi:hypothetical protein
MSWYDPLGAAVKRGVKMAMEDAGAEALQRYRDIAKVSDLKAKIAELEVQHSKKAEEWEKREREVEHKVGLERKRQEFEIEQAKRETTVKVREENLAADKERFKAEMEFQRKHLEGEIDSLRTLVGQMLKRLPSAEIYAIGGD